MARPYAALRGALIVRGMDHRHLARELLISDTCLSRKMNARSGWTLDEAYKTLRLLGRPEKDLPVLFPPGGQNEEGCSRGGAAVAGRREAQGLVKGAGRRN